MASLSSASTLPSTLAANKQLQPQGLQPQPPNSYLDDSSSIAMFTAVGHVGLHLVIRPLFRWGMRSLLMRPKQYIDTNTASLSASAALQSESAVEAELEAAESPN